MGSRGLSALPEPVPKCVLEDGAEAEAGRSFPVSAALIYIEHWKTCIFVAVYQDALMIRLTRTSRPSQMMGHYDPVP